MKKILNKLRELEADLSASRGEFRLFGLFLREDAPAVWDVVASADWIDADRSDAMDTIASEVSARLAMPELLRISRVVLIETNNPGLEDVADEVQVRHGLVELLDRDFFGLVMRRAYVITSTTGTAAPETTRP
jgi:hypothetical protein